MSILTQYIVGQLDSFVVIIQLYFKVFEDSELLHYGKGTAAIDSTQILFLLFHKMYITCCRWL